MTEYNLYQLSSFCLENPEAFVEEARGKNVFVVIGDYEVVRVQFEFVVKVLAELTLVEGGVEGEELVHDNRQGLLHCG